MKDVTTQKITVELQLEEGCATLTYDLLEGVDDDLAPGAPAFGVRANLLVSTGAQESEAVFPVTSDRGLMVDWMARLAMGAVPPVCLREMLEERIAEAGVS